MTRHLIVFVVTFAIGAVIAVILRTGSHKPYEDHRGHPAPGAASAAPATAYDAADAHAAPATPAPATGEHAGHAGMAMPTAPAAPAPAVSATTVVNTNCAICGMPVDPKLGTIAYKGKLIGFGCKACPAKFRAEPETYGEAALKNQVVE